MFWWILLLSLSSFATAEFCDLQCQDLECIVKNVGPPRAVRGEQAWETSKNEFSDSDCPNLNQGEKGSLENCKAFCLEEPDCTAFNYDNSSTYCTLRGCKLPVDPPTVDASATFDGYWHSSTGSCRLGFQCIINRDCPAGHFCASNGQCLRNPCDPSPCGPGAVCSFNPNYFEPICQCAPGLILNCPFGDCEEQEPHITYRPTDFHWEDDYEIEGDAGCVECLEDRDCPDIWRRPQMCVDRHCVEAPQEFNNVSLHSNNEDDSSQDIRQKFLDVANWLNEFSQNENFTDMNSPEGDGQADM